MERRGFFKIAAGGLALAAGSSAASQDTPPPVVIDRPSGDGAAKPHQGKVLALITPHLDDGPIFAGGTLARLLREGYKGYFIRTSNDEKDSYNLTLGETVLANERDTAQFVKTAGLTKCFDLSYRNHRMDEVSRTEFRARLIFLIRLLKVDTILSYDPWGHYEENPDHYVTAQMVEAACWMAADHLDLPEHFDAGLKPHAVTEKYYFARGPHLVNRVVDIGTVMPQKVASIKCCRTMITNMVRGLNDSLAARQMKIPALAGDEDAAVDAFIQSALVGQDRAIGIRHGLEYAEEFHYIGPDRALEDFIAQHAVKV